MILTDYLYSPTAFQAYVANLAAFLTLKSNEEVRTMGAAVAAGYTICAHPALKTELEVAWPEAKFYFHQDANEFPGVLDDYLAGGNCQAMAIGYEDTAMDITFLDRLCREDLVYTDSMVVEIPIAFPIRSDLTSGFSYWMVRKLHVFWCKIALYDLHICPRSSYNYVEFVVSVSGRAPRSDSRNFQECISTECYL